MLNIDSNLPVAALLPELIAQLPGSKVVLQAPPGAGKSTALPLALLAAPGFQQQRIILLQPRRLAAISIAHYLAQQLGEEVGQRVGYHVRGEQKLSASTQLLMMTEGMFVQYLQNDPELAGVGTVIFDEFHERNLFSDLGLAMLLESLCLRTDLSVLVMSATLPATELAQWLGDDTKVLRCEGRHYPIAFHYRPVTSTCDWRDHCEQVIKEALQQAQQGVLVFLPGWYDIQRLTAALSGVVDAEVLPLHRQIAVDAQQRAIAPLAAGRKKVVLATNIAETSLTIEGIDVVVDSGRERRAEFYPRHGLQRLVTRRISQAAATQRAGRAGRLAPGTCYRLWASSDEHGMREYDEPALATEDLTQLLLEAKRWGSDVAQLQFFTPANPAHLQVATQLLLQLDILDERGNLTAQGQRVARMGGDPRLARIAVSVQNAAPEVRAQAALLLAQLEVPARRAEHFPVALSRLSGEARQRWQWWCKTLATTAKVDYVDEALMAELVLWGYPDRVARRRGSDRSYLTAYGGGVQFHQNDHRHAAEWLVALSLNFSERQADAMMGDYLTLTAAALEHPALRLQWQTELSFVGPKQRLQAIESQRLGALVCAQRAAQQQPSASERAQLLCEYVQQSKTPLIDYKAAAMLLARMKFASQGLSEAEREHWPSVDVDVLTQSLTTWAAPYWLQLTSLVELQQWNPESALLARLDYDQQQLLAELCPEYWQAPSGIRHRIDYLGEQPSVALKLQEVFGAPVSPRLCRQRVTLVLELLSPAGRPLQRTGDLASFWQNAYQLVKKEMKGRYPKHPWPDDPLQAQATVKTKRMLNNP